MTPNWTHIIIHHSLTKDSLTVSWDEIKKFHMTDPKHMNKDIGYHFGVEQIENDFQVLVGRPLTIVGAHTNQQNMNSRGIGIMFCGNFDLTIPSDLMLETASRLIIAPLMEIFKISPDHIHRHGDYASYKSCPGTKFPWVRFINILKGYLDA